MLLGIPLLSTPITSPEAHFFSRIVLSLLLAAHDCSKHDPAASSFGVRVLMVPAESESQLPACPGEFNVH